MLTEPVPVSDQRVENPFAIERPHAPADLLYRQCSFRGFDKLVASGSSPFKRQLSLPFGTGRQTVVNSQLRSLQDKQSEFHISISYHCHICVGYFVNHHCHFCGPVFNSIPIVRDHTVQCRPNAP